MSSIDAGFESLALLDATLFVFSFSVINRPLVGFAVRLLRWLRVWSARRDPTKFGDFWLLGGLLVFDVKDGILDLFHDPLILKISVGALGLAIGVVLLCVGLNYRARAQHNGLASIILKQDPLSSPWILPCRTTHTRTFPKRHSFAYSYLTVAVPVGFQGWAWPMLSVDVTYAKGWFHVQASDHLSRDEGGLDLKSKLSHYLRSQGVTDTEWSHAYLITAPRFLGYSFNPVSFWYIYDEQRMLQKMILEVNNTFDERRMYLLDADTHGDGEDGALVASKEKPKFKKSWPKDFHVSPFNSRKGSYSLTATDPFSLDGHTPRPIDNTIVMKSSKNSAKIIARLVSHGEAVNPREMSRFAMVLFIMRWWWVGFMTFPRIVKEAAKLFFLRSLHVWFRPEVVDTSMGRRPTGDEKVIAEFVDEYIIETARAYSDPLALDLKRPDGTNISIHSRATPQIIDATKSNQQQSLYVHIKTPAFYSRFIHYSHTLEAFDRECLFTDEKNRTVSISDPALLSRVFTKQQGVCSTGMPMSRVQNLRWTLHKWLRRPPPTAAYPAALESPTHYVTDIRGKGLSSLDHFVQEHYTNTRTYLRCCAKLFMADRFALGLAPLMHLLDLSIRTALCYAFTVPALRRPTDRPEAADILNWSLVKMTVEILGLWALHIWADIKGT